MPELPEVEAVRRALRPLVRGKRIRSVHAFHPIATRPQSQGQFTRRVEGRRIQEVRRHGKYLFLELDRGLIEMHFRFDGQLIWFSNARELQKRANVAEGVHVDVAFELSKGVLGFADRRHFAIRGGMQATAAVGGGCKVAAVHGAVSDEEARGLKARTEGISDGSAKNRGDRQHLFLRSSLASQA